MARLVAASCTFGVIFTFIFITPTRSTDVLTGQEVQVTDAAADQFDPAISGNIVVYTDYSGVDADVWYTDLSTGLAHPVTTDPGDQQLTGVSGTRIVYTDWNSMDVMLFDVTTGAIENLTEPAFANSLDPAIDGTLVAWTDDRAGNAEIFALDLATREERRITDSVLVDEAPAVRNGVIVWERCEGFSCDVFAYDWASGVTTQITETPYAAEHFPDVSGRIVVFQREEGTPIDKDVVAFNLDTGVETELVLPGDQENAHIDGDFVSFNTIAVNVLSLPPGTEAPPPHVGIWQLSTGAHFSIGPETSGQYLNDIDGQRVVYTDSRAGQLDNYLYAFQIVPGEPDPQAQLQALADLVASLNLKRGIENSLDAKLDAALAALEAARAGSVGTACNQLGAFINEVDAQTGKAITVEDAAALKSAAVAVRASLGCS